MEERLPAADALALLRGDAALAPARSAPREAHGLHTKRACASCALLCPAPTLALGIRRWQT